ncbi:hypothetical protein K438DRAFT_1796213 [Mycena galopus ATCC 62051]|nr:hypothetical protein K438DRAFT_1796213 [Mycena galopus ATCC 62051]
MLGRLRMSVEEAVKAYGELSKDVFSDVKSPGSNGRFKASTLEKAIKQIVRAYSASQDPEEGLKDTQANTCKTFVCTMNAANLALPVLFRTYDTCEHPAMNCTIWQAGRATTAGPTFFKQIKIGPSGMEEAFVDGGMGHNNPIASLLSEAYVLFPDHQIACIISLGAGQAHTISIPTSSWRNKFLPVNVVTAIRGIATNCEKEHERAARYFGNTPDVYFRFNVEQGMQDIQLSQWERLGDVMTHTRQYTQSYIVKTQLADAVRSLSEKIGKVPVSSFNTALPAATEIKQLQTALTLVRCPPPSGIFQGRQDILESMKEYFSQDIGKRHIYVLHGLGGSGKTQIALKFLEMANDHSSLRFTKVLFIDASSLETLDTAFKNIAISHKIGKTAEDASLWLISQIEEWMLLFDNADNTKINLHPFFPKCTHGNIIITSRNPQLVVHGPKSHSKVGDLGESDAIDLLLLSSAKEKTVETVKRASEIVKELSCLPLAIIQAGAYIAQFDCLYQYLSFYKENHAKLLSMHPGQSHDDYRWTVYTTWQISFNRLSKAAAQFLQMCSLLHHDNIPESIFYEAASWSGDDEEGHPVEAAQLFLRNFISTSGTWDFQHFIEIIGEIRGYSLIHRNAAAETLSIHPLVHSWCQTTLSNESTARECMTDIVGMSIKLAEDNYLLRIGLISHIKSLINDQTTIKPQFQVQYAQVYCDSGFWKEAEPIECAVLERQKLILGVDHPDTLRAMANLAHTYSELEKYKDAEDLEVTALEKWKQILGVDHPDTLLSMANLARTYSRLGKYEDAEDLKVTVLEKQKQILGVDHLDTLMSMANLAHTYSELGKYKDAEDLEVTILEKRKQILGVDHPKTLLSMGNLASTYYMLGKYEDAEDLEVTALEKRKQILGVDHLDTLVSMANLASIYSRLGKYEDAEDLEVTALEKRKQILGVDHPGTLLSMANLACTYSELGKYKDAEDLEVTVLGKQKQILGVDHPETLRSMANLARIYSDLGKYKDAEDLEVTILEKRKQILGVDHPDTLLSMANLASTYSMLGKYKDEEDLEVTALEKRKQILGVDHPDTLLSMGNLARTYSELGKYKDAEDLEVTILEKRKQILGVDHPDTLLSMANLASTYYMLGKYEDAEDLKVTVLEKQKQILGVDHPDTLRSMANLARTYSELGKYKDAEDLEVTILEKRKQILGVDHPDTLLSMANLASTYSMLGKYEDAEDLQVTALEKRKQILGAEHPHTLLAMENLACTYFDLEKYQEAEMLEVAVLEKRKQLLGVDHPRTVRAMENLAATYRKLGQNQEAGRLSQAQS